MLHLGVSWAEIGNLPRCLGTPPVRTAGHALGCLFVLEGSRHGGKAIAANLSRNLHVSDSAGCAYFASEGLDIRPRWNRFTTALEVCGQGFEEDAARMVGDCFATLEEWLLGRGVARAAG